MSVDKSPIAIPIAGRTDGIVLRVPWGIALHTTGGGITNKAMRTGKSPIHVAIATYLGMQRGSDGYDWGGPGYVIDLDGKIYQLAADSTRTSHVGSIVTDYRGVRVDRRDQYLADHGMRWPALCPAGVAALWRQAWPGYTSPQDLFPSKRPNTDYIGCELIPCGDGYGDPWNGLRFTEAQHVAAAHLCTDLAARHGWPVDWAAGPRLVGHEDVGLLDRCDAAGGWDPGALRVVPYFDMRWVRERLRAT